MGEKKKDGQGWMEVFQGHVAKQHESESVPQLG